MLLIWGARGAQNFCVINDFWHMVSKDAKSKKRISKIFIKSATFIKALKIFENFAKYLQLFSFYWYSRGVRGGRNFWPIDDFLPMMPYECSYKRIYGRKKLHFWSYFRVWVPHMHIILYEHSYDIICQKSSIGQKFLPLRAPLN